MPWIILALFLVLQGCSDTPNRCTLADKSDGKLTDGVLVTLSSDRTDVAAGQEVRLTFSAGNATEQAKDLIFMSGQKYELYVLNSTGTIVWQWSVYYGVGFTLSIVHDVLPACSYYQFSDYDQISVGGPDGSVTTTWKTDDNLRNPLPPGVYTLYAVFSPGSGYESNRATVTLQ